MRRYVCSLHVCICVRPFGKPGTGHKTCAPYLASYAVRHASNTAQHEMKRRRRRPIQWVWPKTHWPLRCVQDNGRADCARKRGWNKTRTRHLRRNARHWMWSTLHSNVWAFESHRSLTQFTTETSAPKIPAYNKWFAQMATRSQRATAQYAN